MKGNRNRLVSVVAIAALVIAAGSLWWHHSDLRVFLYGQDARGRLLGVRSGLEVYWTKYGQMPDSKSWKDAVFEHFVFETGQRGFSSRKALQNCFALSLSDSRWGFQGSLAELHDRGNVAVAICDPDARVSETSNATAIFDEFGSLELYDEHGKQIGVLAPDDFILTLYVSGSILRQTVRDLDRRRTLTPKTPWSNRSVTSSSLPAAE